MALLQFIVEPIPRVGARGPKSTNLAVAMQSMAVVPLVMAAQARLDQMVTVPVCHKLNSEFETYQCLKKYVGQRSFAAMLASKR